MNTKAFFLLGFLFFSLTLANAQKISESKVPQDVVISFKYKYPDAEVSSWEQNKDIYIAKFKLNDQVGTAEFTDKGVWNVTKYAVSEKELPTPILNYYKENYRSKEFVISVSELQKDNNDNTFYYMLLKIEGNKQIKPVELTFDLTGKLVSKSDAGDVKTKDDGKENKDNKEKADSKKEVPVETIAAIDTSEKYIVDIAKVPALAKTSFATKVKKASGTVWYFQNKIYTAKYNISGKNGQSTFAKDGTWIESRVDVSPETLHQLILAYLKDNYRNFKIKTSELVSQPKDKSIFIRMYDKRSKATPPPLTEIWFSPIGKFLSVTKPDVVDDNELYNKKRKEDKENEFLSDVDKKVVPYENANNYNDKVSFKELPTPIGVYLKQYYKEHAVKSSRLISDDELGNVYYLIVKAEDTKYSVHLYFDLQGKFLKKVDEAENKAKTDADKIPEQKKKVEAENVEEEDQGSGKPISKYGLPEEVVNVADLPASITKYLKKNYPTQTISESYFKSDEDLGNCYLLVLRKSGERKIIKLYFDLDGSVLKMETDSQ